MVFSDWWEMLGLCQTEFSLMAKKIHFSLIWSEYLLPYAAPSGLSLVFSLSLWFNTHLARSVSFGGRSLLAGIAMVRLGEAAACDIPWVYCLQKVTYGNLQKGAHVLLLWMQLDGWSLGLSTLCYLESAHTTAHTTFYTLSDECHVFKKDVLLYKSFEPALFVELFKYALLSW